MRKSSFNKEELLQCGHGHMFGAGNAQLPTDNMLMLDRITHISADGGNYNHGEVRAELDIHPEQWFFSCHFPGDPVMPGCLGLDAMWQLVGFFLAWSGHPGRGRALGAKEIRFTGEVLPAAAKIGYHIHIRRMIKRDIIIGIGNGTVSMNGAEIYSAEGLRVGLLPQEARMRDAAS